MAVDKSDQNTTTTSSSSSDPSSDPSSSFYTDHAGSRHENEDIPRPASNESLTATAAEHEKYGLLGDQSALSPTQQQQQQQTNGNAEQGLGSSHRRRKRRKTLTSLHKSPLHISSQNSRKHTATTLPPSHTHPLFPPLPAYGPPSPLRNVHSLAYRLSSFVLSLSFLGVIVLGTMFTAVPGALRRAAAYLTLRDPDADRPFRAEEKRRAQWRREMARSWKRRQRSRERSQQHAQRQDAIPDRHAEDKEDPAGAGVGDSTYTPTEGGPDPLVCDVGYYARRVGLDVETYEVQTEDGFVIDLWHVYDPREYVPQSAEARRYRGPTLLFDEMDLAQRVEMERAMLAEAAAAAAAAAPGSANTKKPKFPVLLMHGLLQSSGAYCVNDDDSLAFYLCKSGFDVWLGNNRCGFHPKHVSLKTSDPRMWCWNIRQMGVLDLPALVSRVLRETRFARLGLICHSQGTTETLVALAKEQRPELGPCLTVFCALAPAAYAGPLIGKMYFKFMRIISPAMFRILFGLHAFIPLMMQAHPVLSPRVYGWVGYRVFSFLFDWSDRRWDRGLRNRMFQFAPVYVSAESMRWWLGREGFARHKCILATKEVWRSEEEEHSLHLHTPGATAWYDARVPPMALWVAGQDDLVDGRRLLKRLLPAGAYASMRMDTTVTSTTANSGSTRSLREPHVRVVHAKFLPDYEHLDVIWSMDAVDEVFAELREVLWKTCGVQDGCRMPKGCENVVPWGVDEDSSTDAL